MAENEGEAREKMSYFFLSVWARAVAYLVVRCRTCALSCKRHLDFEITMASYICTAALAFSAPPSVSTRRDLLRFGAGSAAALVAFPHVANAEYQGEPPPKLSGAECACSIFHLFLALGVLRFFAIVSLAPADKEALESAKKYKYEARPVAGNEGDAFKAAEAKRAAAQKGLQEGGRRKEESAAETMARLGLKAAS